MNIARCVVLIATLTFGIGLRAQQASSSDAGVVAIQDVISDIRDSLTIAQQQLKGKQLPPLASIDLTLKAVLEKSAGGTLNLWILSFGTKREKDQTQTVTIHLTPPSPDNATKVGP
jgi:hypothetical protein